MKTKIYLMLFALIMSACSEDDLKEVVDDKTDPQDGAEATITVDLSDLSVTMDENPSKGQIVGTLAGTTNNGSITYSIISQSLDSAFSLDQTSGQLAVLDSTLFDFETNPTITAKVLGENSEAKDSATVTISLADLVEIKSVQDKLDDDMTPFEIYKEDTTRLDELYGTTYQGGIIFYFDKTDGSGLIAAPEDQSAGTTWGCNTTNLGYNFRPPGVPFSIFECVAESQGVGNGQSNTDEILNYCSGESAARICAELSIDNYDDWYLPTRNELIEFVTKVPQESGRGYWSSSQRCRTSGGSAAIAVEIDGSHLAILKSNSKRVRAVRSFEEPISAGRK